MKIWIGLRDLRRRKSEVEEFTMIGWKCNEILCYWRGTYWRWTRSPMTKDDPPHIFEPLTDEHKKGWHLQ